MRYLLFSAVLLLAACNKKQEPAKRMPLAGALYTSIKDSLDLSHIEMTTGKEGVLIYMAKFKGNPDRIYASSEKGDVLFTRRITDEKNATVEIQKGNEVAIINIQDGQKRISGRTAMLDHGGKGFCQREAGESFSTCFKAETDEFCDSFISCVALATQPTVSIVIAIACSCNASK
jgi:hypothetical protein